MRTEESTKTALDPATRRHLERAAAALAGEFTGTFSRETVEQMLIESAYRLGGEARFPDYLPVLSHRFARERLLAVAHAAGTLEQELPSVLFVCVQNAGRSQLAAALLSHHGRGRVTVRTAGSAPASEVHPEVVAALEEIGVGVGEEFPKPLTDEVVQATDVVVTMGCGDACPVYPGKRYEDWELSDPSGRSLPEVRAIRDEIEARVIRLLDDLVD